jgi:RNA polymerase sigma factor (sigma-70 family)
MSYYSRALRMGAPSQPASSADASSVGENTTSAHDDGLSTFMSVRPRLFGIVYRMLRSAAEAEDVVQDVWVRWHTVDHSQVRDAEAFLVTTATRLAINVMQSARSRRETYVGPWLPEPVDMSTDPGLGTERREALELGVLRLLEKLAPTERAAYILREAFDYPYRDIANVLRLEEANARQLVTRARRHLVNGRRMPTNRTERRRLLEAFIAAAHNGDVVGLEGRLCVTRPGGQPARDINHKRQARPASMSHLAVARRTFLGERRQMARPAGLEPAAPSLEGSCSIQLSYGRVPPIVRRTPHP